MKSRFIAKPNTWFKEGSECEFMGWVTPHSLDGFRAGLFYGPRIVESLSEGHGCRFIGDEIMDEEVCCEDEFEVIE